MEDTAKLIIDSLCNRSGFDDWWHNIDEDIQEEIIDEIIDLMIINIPHPDC